MHLVEFERLFVERRLGADPSELPTRHVAEALVVPLRLAVLGLVGMSTPVVSAAADEAAKREEDTTSIVLMADDDDDDPHTPNQSEKTLENDEVLKKAIELVKGAAPAAEGGCDPILFGIYSAL